MPCDVLCRFTDEVFIISIFPDGIDLLLGEARIFQQFEAGRLLVGNSLFTIDRIVESGAQRTTSIEVQLPEERRPPAVPELGIGGADICNCHGEQVFEVKLVAHGTGELLNYIRVTDVLALRGH